MSIYEKITRNIVQAIEAGVDGSGFQMPWHGAGMLPRNVSSGQSYQGINVINLWSEGQSKGYSSTEWATFKQWLSLGAQVRKGERGSPIVFWKPWPQLDEEKDQARFILRSSTVFNADQVDGHLKETLGGEAPASVELANRFLSAVPLELRFGGSQAFYNRRDDFIQLPPAQNFFNAQGYYSTLLHEAAHWSGHDTRLARAFGQKFGDNAYAFEELVAELSSAFLCSNLGVSNTPRPDHAEYVAGWLKVLENDTRAIFLAARQAQKAVEFLAAFSVPERQKKSA